MPCQRGWSMGAKPWQEGDGPRPGNRSIRGPIIGAPESGVWGQSAGRWLICGWGAFYSPALSPLGSCSPRPCLSAGVSNAESGRPRGRRELSGARNHTCLRFSKLYQLCNLSSFISTEIKSKCEQLGKLCLTHYSLRKCERRILNFIPLIKYFDHNWLLWIFLKSFEFLFVYLGIHIFFST